MQPLAHNDAGNLHGTALNARVGKQDFTERAVAQLSQSAAPAPQGNGWNQRPGKDPRLIAAKELHLARPRSRLQTQAQDPRFIPTGTAA